MWKNGGRAVSRIRCCVNEAARRALTDGIAGNGSEKPWEQLTHNAHTRLTLGQRGEPGRASISGITATVFGSTGFLGRYVVNALGKMGSRVVIPTRGNDTSWQHLKPMGDLGQINHMYWHPRNDDDIRKAVCKSNVVINLIGRAYGTKNFPLHSTHVDIPARIARISAEEGVSKLVHLSCLGASEQNTSEYYRTKARGEDAVRSEFPSTTVVQPAHIFGPEDHFLRELALLSKKMPSLPVWGGGKSEMQPVHVQDVALGIKELLLDDLTDGETFCFAGPDKLTYKQVVNFVLDTLRTETKAAYVPLFIGRASAYPREVMQKYIRFPLPVSMPMSYDFIKALESEQSYTFPERAHGLKDLGISPRPMGGLAIDFLRIFRAGGEGETAGVA